MHDIDFYSQTTDTGLIELKDNPYLSNLNFTNLVNSETIDIARNGPAAALLLSNLHESGSISISNISSVNISSLSYTTVGDLVISSNSFTAFYAPFLSNVVGSVYITDNAMLSNLNLSSLGEIGTEYGAFGVMNNPLLESLVLPKLFYGAGRVNLTGNFST